MMNHRDFFESLRTLYTSILTFLSIFTFSLSSFAQGDWTEINIATKPVVRYGAAMAYDSNRGVLVLFGGWNHPSFYSDTWEFDGSNWISKSPAMKPSARHSHAMVYDSSRNVVVLFGGHSESGFEEDTWEWNGSNWSKKSPAAKPPNRFDHGMAFDPVRNVTVLFGGETFASQGTYLDDTWEWNGTNWINVTPSTTNPSARRKHALSYDGANQKILLFGGEWSTTRYQDTWLFDGTNWTSVSPSTQPSGRTNFDIAYEATRNKVILHGGSTDSGSSGETWSWDGTNWSNLNPSSTPGPRYQHSMAYDTLYDRVYLFGGIDATSTKKNDLWYIQSNDPPAIESLDPELDSKMWRTFTVVISDLNSANDVDQIWFLINSSLSGSNGAYVFYDAGTNLIKLRNDDGTAWSAGATPGSTVDLNNSQCTLRTSGVTITKSSNNFTINIPLIFKSSFLGKKNVYVYAEDKANAADGWETMGVFYVSPSAMPSVDSLSPSSGVGYIQTFEATCSDADGSDDIRYLYLKISDLPNQADNCAYMRYRRATNKIDLRTNNGASWFGGYILGSANFLENDQIRINVLTSSSSTSANSVTVHLDCILKDGIAGDKKTFMNVYDMDYISPGWQQMGTYTVNLPPENVSVTPDSGTNYLATFQPKFKDSNGTNDIRYLYFKISSSSVATANCAYIRYSHTTHKLDIRTDDGISWTGGTVIGCPGALENSQFILDCAATSTSIIGDEITLNLPLTFKTPFCGSRNIYMNAIDMEYDAAGWDNMGTFTVTEQNFAPTNVSVLPNSGSAGWKTFDAVYRDTNGVDDLLYLYFKIADSPSSVADCVYVRYRCVSGKLDLRTNAGGGWIYGSTIGTSATVQNSQVSINLQFATDTRTGNDLRLRLPLVFKTGFNGGHNIYLYCLDAGTLNSGWQQMGTFTVTASTPPEETMDVAIFDNQINRGQRVFFNDFLSNYYKASWYLDNKHLPGPQPGYKFNRYGMHRINYIITDFEGMNYNGGEDIFIDEKLILASDLTSFQGRRVSIKTGDNRCNGLVLYDSAESKNIVFRLRGIMSAGFKLIHSYRNSRNYSYIGLQEGDYPESWHWILGKCEHGTESIIDSVPAKISGGERVLTLKYSAPANGFQIFVDKRKLFSDIVIKDSFDKVIIQENTVPGNLDILISKPVKR